MRELNEIMYIKQLEQRLAYSQYHTSDCNYYALFQEDIISHFNVEILQEIKPQVGNLIK